MVRFPKKHMDRFSGRMISIKSVSDNYRQTDMAQKIFGYGFLTDTINSQGWELKLLAL